MRIVSLFSGVGGLDLGFLRAGHNIIWANDNDPQAVETYRVNLGDHVWCGPIQKATVDHIPDCDMIIGGFPCQGFSVANWNRVVNDPRNRLYKEMVRIVGEKMPKYFLGENVKGLTTISDGKFLKKILEDFSKLGYEVQYRVLNAADFGVPQTRHRLFIVGRRLDVRKHYDFPDPTHTSPLESRRFGLPLWVTVGEALKRLPEPSEVTNIPNHTYSKYKLRFNGYLGHRFIDPDKPAPTVTGRGDNRGGVVVLHHPSNKRRMSARELAIVQSFPIDFLFTGNLSTIYRHIANAVPPLLAQKVASNFPR